MAEEAPALSRRTGSFPPHDRQQPPREQRNNSLRQFSENVRHIPPQDRGRVHFVAEPDELDLVSILLGRYENPAAYPYGHAPNIVPARRMDGEYIDMSHMYGRPMPVHSSSYSQFRDPVATAAYSAPWPGRRYSRRSTADSYVSDHSQPGVPMRHGRGRVRFTEPEIIPGRSYYSSSPSPPPPSSEYPRAEYLLDSEDDDGRGYNTSMPGSRRARSRSRSISKPRHHHNYPSSYVSDLDEDEEEGFDELLGGKVFQFVPSRGSRSLSKSGHSIDTDVSIEKSEDGALNAKDGPNVARPSNILHVFQSQYTGDAVSEGTHTVKLTVIHDPKKQRQPLFRWMHLEQRIMNLDELSSEISKIPSITDTERNGFAKLLAEVKKTSVRARPTSKGNTVRHMDPRPVRVAIPPDGRTKGQTSRSLTWLCVPYFSLEKYSGLLSASTASSFPIETLLQSEYARTTQERDMQQAVCQNGEAPEGYCFHIAQLWCIVLDNSLLITCGRMSSSALRGDLVRIANEPLKEPIGKMKTVYVSYYDTVLWALPLESCLTWFDFAIHFREFWPQAVRVYHRGHVITETDWPRIVNMVKNVNTKVIFDLRIWSHPLPPAVGALRSLGEEAEDCERTAPETKQQGNRKTKDKPASRTDNNFHVFSWLEATQVETDSVELDVETLNANLQDAEDYLLRSMTMRDRNAYQNCNLSSQRSVHAYLKGKGLRIEKMDDDSQEKRGYQNKVDLYNAADIVFSFFMPQSLGEDTPTVGKFWGAVESLVEIPNKNADDDSRSREAAPSRRSAGAEHNVYPLRTTLRGFTRVIQLFQDILAHAPASLRTKIEVPDDLVRAWLHLVIALIQASLNEEAWNENIIVAEALMRRGMDEIMDELPTEDLLSRSVVQPMELVALVSLKLLQDSTGTYSSINNTYSDYLKGLENEITTNNSDRSHQFRITLFKQEVAIIRRVVASQMNVIDKMTVTQKPGWGDQTRREREMLEREREKSRAEATTARSRFYEKQGAAYMDRIDASSESHNAHYHRSAAGLQGLHFVPGQDPDSFSKLASTDPGGFRELFGRECRSWLERRDNEFLELDIEASRLENMNANKIEVTKDRQEAAVYAFTMVTIIFLPLSTISSIFGMNSSDVRDMDLGQWAYWAAALPTTVAVIVTGLWWMGELHNFTNWLRGLPSRRNTGYARVSPPAANGVIYYPQADYPGIDPQGLRPYSRAALGPPVPRTSWRY
ncbi:hypothetical protein F5Y13DRAFT_204091 [Hypoxylon sp. FL1857]|nr:hypothetical protein F5Y13DRAFT_204091 [Hypoxylon sp. FL1857]